MVTVPTFLEFMQLAEASAAELVDGSNRGGRAFEPRRVEYVGMSFRRKILRFKVGKYDVEVRLPDLKVISKMKGSDEEKIKTALAGDIKVDCTCLIGTTRIKMLNGRDVQIQDLPVGEDVWVYASDANGDPTPAVARSLGITKHADHTLRVTLDNGETVECTHDHLFRARDGGYVEAQHLRAGDSLMPLCSTVDDKGYERVQLNSTGKYVPTHTLVNRTVNDKRFREKMLWRAEVGEKFLVTHHKDSDKRNNDPSNLEWMGVFEHWMFHAALGTERLRKTWEWMRDPANAAELSKKMSIASKAAHAANPELHIKNLQEGYAAWLKAGGREFYSDHFKKNCFAVLDPERAKRTCKENSDRLWADPAFRERKSRLQSEYMKKKWRDDPSVAERSSAVITELNKSAAHQLLALRGRVFSVFRKIEAAGLEINEAAFKAHRGRTSPCPRKMFGSYEEAMVQYKAYNHRVLKVEEVVHDSPVAVYDINVPVHENFALSAGIFVHNCPDFRYGGFRFIGTQLDYSVKPENRPPLVRNPDQAGTVCKHVTRLLSQMDDYVDDIAADFERSRDTKWYSSISRDVD